MLLEVLMAATLVGTTVVAERLRSSIPPPRVAVERVDDAPPARGRRALARTAGRRRRGRGRRAVIEAGRRDLELARPLTVAERANAGRASLQQALEAFTTAGHTTAYGVPRVVEQTWKGTPVESIRDDFVDLVCGALLADSAVAAVEAIRVAVFAQARIAYQRWTSGGNPGDIFTTADLAIFERPWLGGVTSDFLARMLLHADFAGNAYAIRDAERDELVLLRPDWVDIVLAPRVIMRPEVISAAVAAGLEDDAAADAGMPPEGEVVGWVKLGFAYYHGGNRKCEPVVFAADEVAHFAPNPDPVATYRGASWLSPVIREVMADRAATDHKVAFFENAATPNLAVSLPREIDPDDFDLFVEKMDADHNGVENAYRTLYLGGGADVTVVGADMQQLDFKSTQGAGETRIAAAGGVGAVLAKLSEGMQGSALNAGNFGAARRLFADTTARHLWQNGAGSLEVLAPYRDSNGNADPAVRMVCDERHIPFLREDAKDVAEIQGREAETIRTLLDAGFEPKSVIAAVRSNDWTLLVHSGLFSVQLQSPAAAGAAAPAGSDPATGPAPTSTTPSTNGAQAA